MKWRQASRSFTVPTEAMANTVMPGDMIAARRADFSTELPERGTVIVFSYPGHRDQAVPTVEEIYMKRCVAVAGGELEVRDGVVFVNGTREEPNENIIRRLPFSEERIREIEIASAVHTFPRGRGFTAGNWGPMRIPKKGDTIGLSTPEQMLAWATFVEREGHEVAIAGNGTLLVDGRPTEQYVIERDYVFGMGDNRTNSEDSRYWGFIPAEEIGYVAERILLPENGLDRVLEKIR